VVLHSREPYVALSPPTYVVVGLQAETLAQPVDVGDADVLVVVVLVDVVVVFVVVVLVLVDELDELIGAGIGHESERTL
jgi:hypothetical protein